MTTPESHIPTHVGFILDGHRRWARDNSLPLLEGHRAGYKTFKDVGLAALDRGVQFVTAYVWSKENWQRSAEEVKYIMKLLIWVAEHELDDIHSRGVRIRFLGNEDKLSPEVIKSVRAAEAKTAGNKNGTLALCLNYGGREEIVDATKAIIANGTAAQDVTVETIAQHLYAPEIPDVDMIIRSSGEQRLSGFMLWRAAYAELYFYKKNWPDFTHQDLDDALNEYAHRQRRFGA
ncbi:MAG: polyprenyl diphosphate synthase [Candidatus Saccharibacteria bacterium]